MFFFIFFFFNDTATTEIYTLSLHDALPISVTIVEYKNNNLPASRIPYKSISRIGRDRKSIRLNSSHGYISYAVFCLKKKKKKQKNKTIENIKNKSIKTTQNDMNYSCNSCNT